MFWKYAFNQDLWPALISAALTTILGLYSWRRRNVPGARTFAIGCLFATLWVIGVCVEIAAVDFPAKVFWLKFHSLWHLPTVTTLSCFFIQYAGLGRYLTRRNLIMLFLPAALAFLLIGTDHYHHLFWTSLTPGDHVIEVVGAGTWISIGYVNLLGIVNIAVLLWLAIGSARYRWPVVLMLAGQFSGRVMYVLDIIYIHTFSPGESVLLIIGLSCMLYALALFNFHVLDPIPMARSFAIEQMNDGMIVLDLKGLIIDINKKAEEMLARTAASLCSQPVTGILPADAGIVVKPGLIECSRPDISLGAGRDARYFNISFTPLMDQRGDALGHLLLMRDMTEQRQAQNMLLDQQRAVAALQERERLARELHDSIGQVLSYVSLQAQTARKWAAEGNLDKAGSVIGRLAGVAQDAHVDVRESILSLRTGTAANWSFLQALSQYLGHFQSSFCISTNLVRPEGLLDDHLSSATGVQVMRVIQEALTNARKHSGASDVTIEFVRREDSIRIAVTDNGCGFDPDDLPADGGKHFGLLSMQERMTQIGGALGIVSRPGAGTTIWLDVPLPHDQEDDV